MILAFHKSFMTHLRLGNKWVTRRDWSEGTLKRWQAAYDRDEVVHDAYDGLPHRGGKKIGTIRMTERPYREVLRNITNHHISGECFPNHVTPSLALDPEIRRSFMERFTNEFKCTPESELVVIPFFFRGSPS